MKQKEKGRGQRKDEAPLRRGGVPLRLLSPRSVKIRRKFLSSPTLLPAPFSQDMYGRSEKESSCPSLCVLGRWQEPRQATNHSSRRSHRHTNTFSSCLTPSPSPVRSLILRGKNEASPPPPVPSFFYGAKLFRPLPRKNTSASFFCPPLILSGGDRG